MLQSVLCITTNKYLVRVLVVLLHARFSVVGPIIPANLQSTEVGIASHKNLEIGEKIEKSL